MQTDFSDFPDFSDFYSNILSKYLEEELGIRLSKQEKIGLKHVMLMVETNLRVDIAKEFRLRLEPLSSIVTKTIDEFINTKVSRKW